MPRSKKPDENKRMYLLGEKELEEIVIDHVSKKLGLKPPFIHTIAKDLRKKELVITLEPVANVYRFPGKS